MRRLCNVVGWVVVVTLLCARFGALTAPLVLILAADVAVGALIARTATAEHAAQRA